MDASALILTCGLALASGPPVPCPIESHQAPMALTNVWPTRTGGPQRRAAQRGLGVGLAIGGSVAIAGGLGVLASGFATDPVLDPASDRLTPARWEAHQRDALVRYAIGSGVAGLGSVVLGLGVHQIGLSNSRDSTDVLIGPGGVFIRRRF